jgi:hypothetical protein
MDSYQAQTIPEPDIRLHYQLGHRRYHQVRHCVTYITYHFTGPELDLREFPLLLLAHVTGRTSEYLGLKTCVILAPHLAWNTAVTLKYPFTALKEFLRVCRSVRTTC